jgi:hypothetical protein
LDNMKHITDDSAVSNECCVLPSVINSNFI